MRLLLIKVLDADHIYNAFADALLAALLAAGVEAEVFCYRKNMAEFAGRLLGRRYDAVVSFSSFLAPAATSDDGASIFDIAGVGFLGWQFDHPIYVDHLLNAPIARRYSIFPNRNHLRFAQATGMGGRMATLLPGADPLDGPVTPWRARRWPVFVQATWNGEPERVWATLEDSPAKRVLDHLTERLLDDPQASVIDAWEAVTTTLGYDLDYDDSTFGLMRAALNYVRRVDRLKVVTALVESGLPVCICGSGWRAQLGERAGVEYLDSLPFAASCALYGEAQVAIGLNAGNGGCERVSYAMMAGAAVVSDFSAELDFEAGRELALYDRSRPQTVVERTADLLEGDGEAIAEAGRAKAMKTARWSDRVPALLALLQS